MAARKTKTAPTPAPPEDVVHDSVLVERPRKDAATRRREQEEALGGIKNEVFSQSMRVLNHHMRFMDIDPGKDKERDPAYHQMVQELGEEEADKAHRIAMIGWMSANDAPVGVKNAMNIAVGIMKANAAEKGGTKVLNVAKIQIDSNLVPTFLESERE